MKKTPEQKKIYRQELRDRWQKTKAELTAGELSAAKAIMESHGLNFSGISFLIVSHQMKTLGYDGIPYLDCKTYKGWKEAGFQVCKGEKSHIDGITWIEVGEKPDSEEEPEESGYCIPRGYHLFHRSQVA